jgi:hypothetical protein
MQPVDPLLLLLLAELVDVALGPLALLEEWPPAPWLDAKKLKSWEQARGTTPKAPMTRARMVGLRTSLPPRAPLRPARKEPPSRLSRRVSMPKGVGGQ